MKGVSAAVAQGMSTPANIAKWQWHDPWGGHFLTHGRARVEAEYARRMHDAAMRGQLAETFPYPTTSEPSKS